MKYRSFFMSLVVMSGVTLAEAQQSLSEQQIAERLSSVPNPQILDVRSAEEYAVSHIKGAVNTTRDKGRTDSIIASLDPNLPTLTYSNVGRGRGVSLAKELQDKGFKEVYYLKGGLAGWVGAGLPVESAASGERFVSVSKFEQAIADSELLLVEFSTIHCPGCQRLKPILAELQSEYSKLQVLQIDFDDNLAIFREEKIQAVPVLRIYKKGEIVWDHLGFTGKEAIEDEIKKAL